ncbi:DUF4760 domain-containing protein [Hoeflea alexandrii]
MSETNERKLLGLAVWRWEAFSYFITTLGALGIVLGVYQYVQQLEANRARETLAMIEIWETRGYREDFDALSRDMVAYWDNVPKQDIELAKANQRAAANLRKAFFREMIDKSAANMKRFDRVVYFFNRLGLCIEAQLCSPYTARVFFEDTITAFLSNFEPRIAEKRKTLPGYANGVFLLRDEIE